MSHSAEEPTTGRAASPPSSAVLRKGIRGGEWNPETDPLVLFDGLCNFCSGSVQFLAPRDRRKALWFTPMQSASGQAVLAERSIPTTDWASFVLVEAGQAYFRSEALFRTLRFMTYPWPLLRIGMILPRPIADWLYDRVARNRYAVFGKKSACMIPTRELAARFLP